MPYEFEYRVLGEPDKRCWHVFVVHFATADWFRLVATFASKDRAETYCQIENECRGDYEARHDEQPHPDPVAPEPPSGIDRYALRDNEKRLIAAFEQLLDNGVDTPTMRELSNLSGVPMGSMGYALDLLRARGYISNEFGRKRLLARLADPPPTPVGHIPVPKQLFGPSWADQNAQFVRLWNDPKITTEEIATALNRTVAAVKQHARNLKLPPRPEVI